MIITLTLNPAVDQTAWLEKLELGVVNRIREAHLDPAGKGINASRMAHRLRWPTVAFGFLAGETGGIVERALRDEGVQYHFVQVGGLTRINMTVIDEAETATTFCCPGPMVRPADMAALDGVLRFWLQGGRVLVLAGSLPPGVPPDTYAGLITAAHEHGVHVILDSDGEALRLGLAARPDSIKPNVAEAERLLGRKLGDATAVERAARELARRGISTVVISMGADGAFCASGERVFRVRAPRVHARSTVGSGDSMVAGMAVAVARGQDTIEMLRLGTAAGAATAMTAGTALGTSEAVESLLSRVSIEEVA